jgi:hypothetical protein
MANLIDAGGSGAAYARGVVAQAQAAILPQVRALIAESIGRIAVRAGGNLAAIGIRSALMFDPAATAVLDDPDHEQVIVPLSVGGAALPRCTAYAAHSTFAPATGAVVAVPLDSDGADPFDPGNWHDEATSSPYIVLPEDGDYLVHAYFAWDTSGAPATNQWNTQLWIYGGLTGSTSLIRDEDTWNWPGGLYVPPYPSHTLWYANHLVAGTKINMRGRQDSGGATLTYGRAHLAVLKIG